jgi:hypothetical protein
MTIHHVTCLCVENARDGQAKVRPKHVDHIRPANVRKPAVHHNRVVESVQDDLKEGHGQQLGRRDAADDGSETDQDSARGKVAIDKAAYKVMSVA